MPEITRTARFAVVPLMFWRYLLCSLYLRRRDGGKETDEIIVLIKSAMSLRLRLGTSHVCVLLLPYKWVMSSGTLETADGGALNVTVHTQQRLHAFNMGYCF